MKIDWEKIEDEGFCSGGMNYIFDHVNMDYDYEGSRGDDLYADLRKKLGALDCVVGRIRGSKVVRFVEAYRDYDRVKSGIEHCKRSLKKFQETGRADLLKEYKYEDRIKEYELEQPKVEKRYNDSCFTELREVLKGKPFCPNEVVRSKVEAVPSLADSVVEKVEIGGMTVFVAIGVVIVVIWLVTFARGCLSIDFPSFSPAL